MAIKLDMSQAYDRVEWVFIEMMMLRLGFSANWVNMIMGYVRTMSYSFILNGEVTGFFRPTRGLRQGVPLSPYLFLICIEGLSSLINKAHANGSITGFKCRGSGRTITHLFFTDDSLLFSQGLDSNCLVIRGILDDYASASCQLVNVSKSVICVSPTVSRIESERLAALLGIRLVRGVIEAGAHWRVGMGTEIYVYQDRWVPRPTTVKIISPPWLGGLTTVSCPKSALITL
ncbi:hypothetical protein Dsin_005804 [Dipteronia sinensis]|uniref:Reverse transcriptase domain-containing protein n=1 Tax=Dipteronia sinensis TaxID=43782 RepID=A0AAE0AYG4_9ROSI|nr:hypothetical protein Dsin_005804 [Dipteronia sinensis]